MSLAFLFNWRLWLALALAGVLAYSHLTVYRKGEAHVQAKWDESVAVANADARKLEQERQRRADDAARIAAQRESRLLADSARARASVDGLRDDLRAANEYAKESRAAAERIASVATDLFGRCTARYIGVAEAAQRSDGEARELRDAWPR